MFLSACKPYSRFTACSEKCICLCTEIIQKIVEREAKIKRKNIYLALIHAFIEKFNEPLASSLRFPFRLYFLHFRFCDIWKCSLCLFILTHSNTKTFEQARLKRKSKYKYHALFRVFFYLDYVRNIQAFVVFLRVSHGDDNVLNLNHELLIQ